MTRWSPWRALRHTDVELWFAPLGGLRGLWERRGDHDQITLDSSLDRQSRREVLAHELVHAERGIGWPVATAATMQLEEERVWRIAMERLVPSDELHRFIERQSTVGPVTLDDVADEFDLSPDGARRVAARIAREPGWDQPACSVVDPEAVNAEGDPDG